MRNDPTLSNDEPAREALRSWLREWRIPGPPADLEQDLRRGFRRSRRPARPRALWLALAAALALMALSRLLPSRPAAPSFPPAAPTGLVASPQHAVKAPRGPGRDMAPPATAPTAAKRTPRPPSAPADRAGADAVIVEAGQAELLAQLGRALGDAHQAVPGAVVPDVEVLVAGSPVPAAWAPQDGSALRHAGDWETVARKWPSATAPGIWR
jgi:hypothetical protein